MIVLISEQGLNPLHQGTEFSFYCMKTYLLETQLRSCLWGAEGQRSAGLGGLGPLWGVGKGGRALKGAWGKGSRAATLQLPHPLIINPYPLDRKTSEMEWKIEVSEGWATIVSAELANCHGIIPLSEFCSVLFVCLFLFPQGRNASSAEFICNVLFWNGKTDLN